MTLEQKTITFISDSICICFSNTYLHLRFTCFWQNTKQVPNKMATAEQILKNAPRFKIPWFSKSNSWDSSYRSFDPKNVQVQKILISNNLIVIPLQNKGDNTFAWGIFFFFLVFNKMLTLGKDYPSEKKTVFK